MNDQDSFHMSDGMRHAIHALIIISALATCLGRIGSVRSKDGRGPFLSANDRSRWCTIRNLVERNTYVIDRLQRDKRWQTIDKVRHIRNDITAAELAVLEVLWGEGPVPAGRIAERLYGSQAPRQASVDKALARLASRKLVIADQSVSPEVWRAAFVRDELMHFYSSKPPLFPTIVAAQYWLISKTAGATFQDYPFAVTRTILIITNLVPLAIYFWLLVGLIERWCETDWGRIFAVAAAAWGTYLTTFVITLNNHLPAAICTLIALHVFISIWYDEKTQARYFILAGLAAAFAAANELPALSLLGLLGLALLWKNWKQTLLFGTPAVLVIVTAFFALNYVAHGSLRPPYAHREDGANWYDYEGSYWTNKNKRVGVDVGEPSRTTYAFHSLLGHHGIISLTPIWCLSAFGVFLLAKRDREVPMPALATGISILTFTCLAFYLLLRPEIDRNYGGVSSGFRWMFWFTPLWIFAMLPALDRIAYSAAARRVAYALFAVSVFSTSYPSANPWQHPWPYELMRSLGWIIERTSG